ncbi:MAG: pilus assembly protein PilP [Thiobacillaceae bacterium]|nr:pilus assembly protein PilP [Thiobacillaceae bacterium]MDW8323379.1 pilus assembly protein PilP [Burkholderiales bacterium]
MKLPVLSCLAVLLLTGCAGEDMSDLRQFLQEAGRDSQEKLDPLPVVKAPTVFSYDPSGLADPFSPRNLRPAGSGGGPAPDMNRPREYLENFPLDGLRMVGTLKRGGQLVALVRTPDNAIYQVRVGSRIGQNFGVVTAISDTAIQIRETVQDGVGDWIQTTASLSLQE